MPAKLSISQIFIPNHKQAAYFVSAYQETVHAGGLVDLFLIVEIRGDKKSKIAKKQEEYEKIAQTLARALKSNYLAERQITEATFEKALAAINHELSTLGRRGVVNWYKKLNALVAVCAGGIMYLSATGQMSGLLLRKREFSQISESLSDPGNQNPIKTFGAFASGALLEGDTILLTTISLYNYLSLERLRGTLGREELTEASKQLIDTLKSDMGPTDAFAAFVCAYHARPKLADSELAPLVSPTAHILIDDSEALVRPGKKYWQAIIGVGFALIKLLVAAAMMLRSGAFWIWGLVSARFHPLPAETRAETRSPKPPAANAKSRIYLVAFMLAASLLAVNLIFFNFRNARQKVELGLKAKLETAQEALINAEAAMIYSDENRARTEVALAETALAEVKKNSRFETEARSVQDKLDTLSLKLNKITRIEQTEILGNFSHTPNELIKLPEGFLGFNNFTDSLQKLQFPASQAQALTQDQPVPEDLVDGIFLPAYSAPVFLSSSGRFFQLTLATGEFSPLFATSTAAETSRDLKALALYDDRLYGLDPKNSQILRYAQSGQSIQNPTQWLKQTVDLSSARDLGVDGNIFVLTSSAVLKFTLGQPQTFATPQLSPGLNAIKLRTEKSQNYIYLLDPDNSRIVMLTKSGGLAGQLVSDKFSELKDIFVDEAGKTIYYLSGNELGRFGY